MNNYSLQCNRNSACELPHADFKCQLADFKVNEVLSFTPSGVGEHVFFYIEKHGMTTDELITDVAKALGVNKKCLAYSGLKDKHAITCQWLSVVLPIKSEIPYISGEKWRVLQALRHDKKLRRGVHSCNEFVILLNNIVGDMGLIKSNLVELERQGFPNYFGLQRFGRNGKNIVSGHNLLLDGFKCSPFKRSMYLSAIRAYLFNRYLSLRVADGSWNKTIAGDVFMLSGSHSIFDDDGSDGLQSRIDEHDIDIAGPLVGEGPLRIEASALSSFQSINSDYTDWYEGLKKHRVKTQFRPLRVFAKGLHCDFSDSSCQLSFSLPAGSFATALLHELVKVSGEVW